MKRSSRLVSLVSKFIVMPSKSFSVTELAEEYKVSKTVISEDISAINSGFEAYGFGQMTVERGRIGGAKLLPVCSSEYRAKILGDIAARLSVSDRYLPGGLIYYSDLIFNPEVSFSLGLIMASLFVEAKPDVVMTTEVKGIPVSLFAAYALGCPLAVCRFRNRPSDGAAVAVHFPVANGDVRTIYMGTHHIKKGSRVLVLDDFMRGGSTVAGMQLMVSQFDAETVGTGVFITASNPEKKAIPEYKTLLNLYEDNGNITLKVADN